MTFKGVKVEGKCGLHVDFMFCLIRSDRLSFGGKIKKAVSGRSHIGFMHLIDGGKKMPWVVIVIFSVCSVALGLALLTAICRCSLKACRWKVL